MAVLSYVELHAWQRAMDLVEQVHMSTGRFPADERFGLTSQLRRSAVSVPSNVAEGQGRQSTKDFVHFLSIAYGSLCETQTQLMIAARLHYIDRKEEERLLVLSHEVGRLINGLIRSLGNRSRKRTN